MEEIYVVGKFNEFGGQNELATLDKAEADKKIKELIEEVESQYDDDCTLIEEPRKNGTIWTIEEYEEGVYLEIYISGKTTTKSINDNDNDLLTYLSEI